MSIRIIVADDHTLVRETLARILDEQDDIDVIGEAANGDAAMEMTMQLRPDVVVMDVSMPPVLSGLEATRWIRVTWPDVKIVALSMHAGAAYVAQMFEAGANAYLLKDADIDELLTAIRSVACGETFRGTGLDIHPAGNHWPAEHTPPPYPY